MADSKGGKKQLSWEEYQALKEKEAKKSKGFTIPQPVKVILFIPFILIALFGIFYIPFLAFRSMSAPSTAQTPAKAHPK